MDFSFTEPEKMLQGLAREFAAKEVQPQAAEIDRGGQFPFALAEAIGKSGYHGLPYPVEYGGSGAGYVAYVLALEQICRASVTVGAIIAVSTVVKEAVFRFGTGAQKKALLTPLAQGKWLGTIAFTEAETGSDPEAITTVSRQSGDGYLITGEKQFISLAPSARLALVWAKGEGKGLNAFLVDMSSPGVTIGEPLETMGLRGLGTSAVYLNDVYVPAANRLGKEGQGFEVLLEAISLGRLGVAAEAVGIAQSALELSLDYSRQKKVKGKPLARMPTIQWHLAEMASRTEAARWLLYRTAFLRDRDQSIRYESAVAKLFASQAAVEVTRMAMQVHGSYGTVKSLPVERLYRDAKMTEIYVGISELQRSLIAGYLMKD